MSRLRVDLKSLGVALAIVLALQLWFMVDSSLNLLQPQWGVAIDASKALVHLGLAVCVLVAVRWADREVDGGRAPWRVYPLAVGLGVTAGSALQYLLHVLLQVPDNPYGTAPIVLEPRQMFRVGLEYVLWVALIVGIHVTLRQHRQAEARMHEARLSRERTRRHEVEMRLEALQARVEPRLLRDALGQVRQVHDRDAGRAAAMLDALVDYLRAALPQLRETGSTWRRELELVRAWLAMKGQGMADVAGEAVEGPDDRSPAGPIDFAVDFPAERMDASLPPVLLLPAVQLVLSGAQRGTLRLACREAPIGSQVDLTFEGDGAVPWRPDAERVEELQARLSIHYGVAARFEVGPAADRRRTAVMRLPGTF